MLTRKSASFIKMEGGGWAKTRNAISFSELPSDERKSAPFALLDIMFDTKPQESCTPITLDLEEKKSI